MKRDNFYWLSKSEKIEVFNEIQRKTQLPAATIEKDWWVVQTLEIVFEMDVARHLIFKGGTSLSKAWKLVERFSEDIDLALAREFLGFPGDISRTQVGKLRDASFEYE
jgi:predicted nucleotidyltransferase component of viral defense system